VCGSSLALISPSWGRRFRLPTTPFSLDFGAPQATQLSRASRSAPVGFFNGFMAAKRFLPFAFAWFILEIAAHSLAVGEYSAPLSRMRPRRTAPETKHAIESALANKRTSHLGS
jgi:hypothetical protein